MTRSTKIFVDTTNTFVVKVLFMRRPPKKPTAAELEILRVLWTRGPSTVREVQEALQEKKAMVYTSVLKFLQIMTAKGTVRRNESQRAHIYEACLPAEQTKRQLAGDMLQRVFEGSASQLMMHALAGRRASREEIEELRRWLDDYERSRR
jgi:BlaI family transcriptional regulator, penicillinase repressor